MIYLDNAATTKMLDKCLERLDYCNRVCFFNPSALYGKALDSENIVKESRSLIAKSIGASQNEIIFTASGSESDNIAMFCAIKAKKGTILVGSTEHSAVYNSAIELERRGFDVKFIPCDRFGVTKLDELAKMLDESVILVSIMHVCNETGAQNDLEKISKLIKSKSPNAIFHSDGVQAFGKIHVNVKTLGVDLYSISGHKIHAPKGVGALYCRQGVFLKTFIFGGGQEFNVRSATENVGGISAFSVAVEDICPKIEQNYQNMRKIQEYAIDLLKKLPHIVINTNIENSAPTIINCAFDNMRGEVLVHCMEQKDIIIGTGSACSAKKAGGRIAKALGLDDDFSHGMLRISFDAQTKKEDIDIFVSELSSALKQMEAYQKK